MDYDKNKVDEAVLALLFLTLTGDQFGPRAWKGHDWDALDRLHEQGFISNPKGKAKSVILTPEGLARSEELFFKLFGAGSCSSDTSPVEESPASTAPNQAAKASPVHAASKPPAEAAPASTELKMSAEASSARTTSVRVSVQEFVNELDSRFGDDMRIYLNRKTGEFVQTTPDELGAAEEGDDDLSLEVGDELAQKIREVLESDDWIGLPSKYEIDEYRIMSDFADTLADETLGSDLSGTIGGRGTFGRFKDILARHGLLDAWYRFRDESLKQLARRWLEAREIPYKN